MAEVSVVIPSYNSRGFIAATLESVLGQADRPAQVIVIDDGSTDDSAAIVEGFVGRSGGVVELVRQANAGESRARNVGIGRARCPLIAFLDADDLWLAGKTGKQVEMLAREPAAVGVHTRVFNFRQTLDDLAREETEKTKDDPGVEELIDYHYVCPSALMVRTAVVREGGVRFEEAVRHAEDMLFIADLRLAGRLRLVDELLTAKRVHGGQQTKNPRHTILSTRSRLDWCRSRAGKLGTERAVKMEAALGAKLVEWLERRYWRREMKGFAEMRREVGEMFPRELEKSVVGKRMIWPGWVYRVVDGVGGAKRKR